MACPFSVLPGIASVKNPIFKASTRSHLKEKQYIVWSRLDRTELGVGWTVAKCTLSVPRTKAAQEHSALREEKRKKGGNQANW